MGQYFLSIYLHLLSDCAILHCKLGVAQQVSMRDDSVLHLPALSSHYINHVILAYNRALRLYWPIKCYLFAEQISTGGIVHHTMTG